MTEHDDDPLAFFRGCLFALPFACIFWTIVFIVVLVVAR